MMICGEAAEGPRQYLSSVDEYVVDVKSYLCLPLPVRPSRPSAPLCGRCGVDANGVAQLITFHFSSVI